MNNITEIKFAGNLYIGINITLIYESLHIVREVYQKGCACDKCYINCYVFRTQKNFMTFLSFN